MFAPQIGGIAAGFAIIWALAWRRQEAAVAAIEERDGVRFYVDKTSPLRAIRLIRTPGFGGDFLHSPGLAGATPGIALRRSLVYAVMELLGRDPQLASATRAIGAGASRFGPGARAAGARRGWARARMLAEIGERARAAGLRVVAGRGVEHERDIPFGVMCDALGELAGTPGRGAGGGALPPPPRGRRRRSSAWRRSRCCSTTCTGPTRPRSSWCCTCCAARVPRAGAAGDRARARSAPPRRLLDAARSAAGWEELELAPLGRDDAHAMVAGVADAAVRERVVLEGRGNPLFLRELARVADRAEGALPRDAGRRDRARGRGAGRRAAQRCIEGAAVAGDPFDPELAAAAAELDAADALAALDGLVAADLVRPRRARTSRPRAG